MGFLVRAAVLGDAHLLRSSMTPGRAGVGCVFLDNGRLFSPRDPEITTYAEERAMH